MFIPPIESYHLEYKKYVWKSLHHMTMIPYYLWDTVPKILGQFPRGINHFLWFGMEN